MAEFKLPKNSTLTKGVTHKVDGAAKNTKTFVSHKEANNLLARWCFAFSKTYIK